MQFKSIVKWKSGNRWMQATPTYEADATHFYVHVKEMRSPNISSHTLVNLIGLNNWTSPGEALLAAFGFLEKDTLDPYQIIKGGLVEHFADQYIREIYDGRVDLESFEVHQFENFNQFTHQPPFSGALDKLLNEPVKLPIEIKSKEMKAYNEIAVQDIWPEDHLAQGMNQAYFVGASRFMMLYGFLSEHASLLLRTMVDNGIIAQLYGNDTNKMNYAQMAVELGFTYEMFTFHHKIFEVDNKLVEERRKKALDMYNAFFETRRIPKSYFKRDQLAALNRYKKA